MKYFYKFNTEEEFNSFSLPDTYVVVVGNKVYIKGEYQLAEVRQNIPNNEIHYTSSDGRIVVPNNANAFGANILSNTYENGGGIIKFDNDITSIDDFACNDLKSLTSINIPSSVTTIGRQAFYACEALKNITIPSSVTSIGTSAFYRIPSQGNLYFTTSTGATPSDMLLDNFIGWELYINGEHIGTITPKVEGGYYYVEEQEEMHDFYLGDGYNGTYMFIQEAHDSLWFLDTKPFEGKIIKSVMSNRGNEGIVYVGDADISLSYKEQKPIEWIDVEFE